MMLEPSIDKLLDQVDSKYSLVVLEAKRAHELRDKERPTKEFKAVKILCVLWKKLLMEQLKFTHHLN